MNRNHCLKKQLGVKLDDNIEVSWKIFKCNDD